MESNKPLAAAGYLIGVLLVVLPLFDIATTVWPPHLADERWRFGALGSLSNVTLVPLLGLLLIISVATVWNHHATRRTVGALAAVFALALAALAVLFVLDFFQTRSMVRPQFKGPMTVAASAALVKHVLAIITLALLSRAGFAGPRPVKVRRVAAAPAGEQTLIPTGAPARAE